MQTGRDGDRHRGRHRGKPQGKQPQAKKRGAAPQLETPGPPAAELPSPLLAGGCGHGTGLCGCRCPGVVGRLPGGLGSVRAAKNKQLGGVQDRCRSSWGLGRLSLFPAPWGAGCKRPSSGGWHGGPGWWLLNCWRRRRRCCSQSTQYSVDRLDRLCRPLWHLLLSLSLSLLLRLSIAAPLPVLAHTSRTSWSGAHAKRR